MVLNSFESLADSKLFDFRLRRMPTVVTEGIGYLLLFNQINKTKPVVKSIIHTTYL